MPIAQPDTPHVHRRPGPPEAASGPQRHVPTTLWAVLVLAALLPAGAGAQDTCQTSLQDASADYAQGRFDAAQASIAECLGADPVRAEKTQAW